MATTGRVNLSQTVKHQQSLLAASAALLISGSMLYICYRPTTLLMFHWAAAIGLGPLVIATRELARSHFISPPLWVTDSLPFAMYVASYMLAIMAVWHGSRERQKWKWVLVVPAMAGISEIGQAIGLVPGTFDWRDLALLCTVPILALAATAITSHAHHVPHKN